MVNAYVGPAYAELGQLIIDDAGVDAKDPVMYAEVMDGAVDCAIFYQNENSITFRQCRLDTIEKIYDIWEISAMEDCWSGIIFEISGSKFRVSIIYSTDFRDSEYYSDRSRKVAVDKFGEIKFDYSNF